VKAFLVVLTFFATGDPDVTVSPKLLPMSECGALSQSPAWQKGFTRNASDGRTALRVMLVCQPIYPFQVHNLLLDLAQ